MHVKTPDEWALEREPLLAELRAFAALMREAPFRNRHGLRGVSAFALYWFLRRLAPTVVFEVGVWRGFSTWIAERAVPGVEIHAFDPLLMVERTVHWWWLVRRYRSPRVTYSFADFSCAPIRKIASGHVRPLAFFDDHQNKLARLRQCREAGIRDVVFDDNMPGPYTHETLEHVRQDPVRRAALEREVEEYAVFPALWPVDFEDAGVSIHERGLGFPVEAALEPVYRDRRWHSFVTYVRLA